MSFFYFAPISLRSSAVMPRKREQCALKRRMDPRGIDDAIRTAAADTNVNAPAGQEQNPPAVLSNDADRPPSAARPSRLLRRTALGGDIPGGAGLTVPYLFDRTLYEHR